MTRLLTGLVVVLAAGGMLAVAGLAVPVARDSLGGVSLTPAGSVVTMTSAPMIRTSFANTQQKLTWLSPHARTIQPLPADPDCDPPQGWV